MDNHVDDITARIRFAADHNAEDALPDREDSIEDDVGRISAPTDVVDAVDPEQGSTDSRSGGRADGSGSENVGVRTRAGVSKLNGRAPGLLIDSNRFNSCCRVESTISLIFSLMSEIARLPRLRLTLEIRMRILTKHCSKVFTSECRGSFLLSSMRL